MKKSVWIGMMAAAMVLGSCGGKQQAQVEETQETEKNGYICFQRPNHLWRLYGRNGYEHVGDDYRQW